MIIIYVPKMCCHFGVLPNNVLEDWSFGHQFRFTEPPRIRFDALA